MKIISIDNRLKDIASFVDNVTSIADIGTDHGYLSIYLIQKQIATMAYATDVAINPLNIAKENIEKCNLSDKIKLILCDGLSNVPLVDTVIIAGMGGNLIIDILKNRKHEYPTYILQANNAVDALREYLTNNNFKIIDEKISYVHKKYYEIIKVVPGYQKLNNIEITYGPINLLNKTDLFIKKWSEILKRYIDIANDFKGSDAEFDKIKSKIIEIENILKTKALYN